MSKNYNDLGRDLGISDRLLLDSTFASNFIVTVKSCVKAKDKDMFERLKNAPGAFLKQEIPEQDYNKIVEIIKESNKMLTSKEQEEKANNIFEKGKSRDAIVIESPTKVTIQSFGVKRDDEHGVPAACNNDIYQVDGTNNIDYTHLYIGYEKDMTDEKVKMSYSELLTRKIDSFGNVVSEDRKYDNKTTDKRNAQYGTANEGYGNPEEEQARIIPKTM